jgi:multicomponent Na+:H+ antiporter subunit B
VTEIVTLVLLLGMAATAVVIARLRGLFGVVMLTGFFSFLSASLFVVMDAVDVAFTEAAVGAGVSTVLMLGALALTSREEKTPIHKPLMPLIVAIMTGGFLVYGTLDMPEFGDPNAVIHTHLVTRYIEQSGQEIGVPNMVTSVLASYRGYDTLGETTVIFTAGVAVMMLLGLRRRRRDET